MEVKAVPAAESALSQTHNSDLEVRISKRFSNPEQAFDLNVHFRVPAGFTILFGASGTGKTTVLDCIAGLSRPDKGRIAVGEDLFDSDKQRDMPAWKRRIGYVIQDLALFPHLTAEENVAFGINVLSAAERQESSREMLRTFRIEHLRDRRPAQISGGERQRVALVRSSLNPARSCSTSRSRRSITLPSRISSTTSANGTSRTAFRSSMSRTAVRKSLRWANSSSS